MSAADNSNQPSTNNNSEPTLGVSESRLGNYYEYAVIQTLEKFLSTINYSLLKKIFPKISKECDAELRELCKDLVKQLKTTITTDIKKLTEETKLFKSLKSLDDMVTEQKNRAGEDSWRPSGNPEDDIRDHIYDQKLKQKRYLEFILETLKVENNKLEETLEENHAQILKLKEECDADNQEVQSNFATVDEFDFLKFKEDIHAMFGKH